MNNIKKIFITGGAGYVGSMLTLYLLSKNYQVIVYDLMIYGDTINDHPNLQKISGDIRDENKLKKTMINCDAVIHLACISNDPSFELNPILSKSINMDSFEPLVKIARDLNVQRFIYASSSSVYGLKNDKNVKEDMTLDPLTDYSKFKANCELILKKYSSQDFTTVTLRPATVCGFSNRQRLDVVVNILTNLAFHKREITVFGGSQLRPNIHISDMIESYLLLLKVPKKLISNEVFNVGYENNTVLELAIITKKIIGDDVNLVFMPTDDNRSYHISSEKIFEILNFKPSYTVENAVTDLKNALMDGKLPDSLTDEKYYNIKKMNSINLV